MDKERTLGILDYFGIGVGALLLILAVGAAVFFPVSALVMLAWNGIVGIFGLAFTVTYVQAMYVTIGLWLVGGAFSGVKYTPNKKD